MYINCTFDKWNIFIKNTNYEKTDKLNFNSALNNVLLNDWQQIKLKKNDWHLVWLD
jgi:hypothetical protein